MPRTTYGGDLNQRDKPSATSVGNYIAAVQTLLAFLPVAIGLASVSITAPPPMSEEQALQIATH